MVDIFPFYIALMMGIWGLTVLIAIVALLKRRRDKKSGFPLQDERTQKINGIAATYALYIGQYFIIAYVLVTLIGEEFFGMLEIEAGYPMIAALLVFNVSYLVLRWYLGRKGEL